MPVRPLSKELKEIAKNELNEVPSRVQADLDHIKEWISQQPHLKARTDDQWLITFLRASKFSLQRTKEKIDLFYTVRSLDPKNSKRDPFSPEIQDVLSRGLSIPLPKTAHAGAPIVCIHRGYKMDPEKITLNTYLKVLQMLTEIAMMENDNYGVAGISAIFDLRNLSFSYMSQLTPDFIKSLLLYSQDAYPMRLKLTALVGAPPPIVMLYNTVKILFKEKLRSRIFFYKDDQLKNINNIPISILPKDYGGEETSSDEIAAYWKKKVESYRDWFLEDAQYGVDESKRPGKSTNLEAPFGVEGSFIKLEID